MSHLPPPVLGLPPRVSFFASHVSRHRVSILLFGLALSLYIFTLAPSLLPADAGEFQTVAPLLGVAHPPGFALYTLLSRLFISLARVGTYAYRLNLFSAVTAALTLVLIHRAVYRLTASHLAGLVAAFALGVSTTFWSQATTANIRSLAALLTALAALALIEYRLQPTANRLAFLGFCLTLAVIHHLSLAFIAVVFALAALWFTPRPLLSGLFRRRGGMKIALATLAPLLLLLYFPLRAGAFLAPPNIATLPGLLQHVLAAGFGGDFFYFATFAALPDRLAILFNIFLFQFNAAAVNLLALGLVLFFLRDWKLALALTVAFALHCFIAITYRAPQTVEYLLPAYVVLVIAAGGSGQWAVGSGQWTVDSGQRAAGDISLRRAATVGRHFSFVIFHSSLFIASLFIAFRNLPSYLALARDDSTRTYAEAALALAPPDALILASWHYATPLWYLQHIEGKRLDVTVEYVYPQGTSLAQNWVDTITANMAARPTLVTDYYPQEYAEASFHFAPVGLLWQAFPAPLTAEFFGFTPGDGSPHAGGWVLKLGGPFGKAAAPGETGHAITMWQAPPSPTPVNFFVQLLGPDGLLYGQMDVSHAQIAPGEVLADRYDITPNIDAPPGDYRLVAGAYLPDGTRLAPDFTDLGALTLGPRATPPATRHPRPFGLLAGYDYDLSLPDSPRVYLHWRLDGQPHTVRADLRVGPQGDPQGGPQGDHTGSPLPTISLPPTPGYLTTALDLPPDWQTLTLTGDNFSFDIRHSSFGISDRYISFGPLVLVGSAITREADGSYRVDLDWLADRPLTEDEVIKVDLVGEGYAWRDQSDSVPAGGALPTLKWIPGIVIHDRHRLKLLQATPATFQLAVYDHFTRRNLPILDSRLAQLGPTVPLGTTTP